MSIFNKPLDQVKEDDLKFLVDNKVSENKIIEYKLELPKNSDGDKKEFLYDVSSFANASGGYLIYGIKAGTEEDKSEPTDLTGLEKNDIDETIRGLRDQIQSGIRPKIPGLQINSVDLKNDRYILIIYIPNSFASPHMVTFKNASRFYTRHSKGKEQLDVDELRTAFNLSQSITDRIRNFRRERVSMIIADETPVFMNAGAKLVLHIIPISSLDRRVFQLSDLLLIRKKSLALFYPLGVSSGNYGRYNLEGYLTYMEKKPEYIDQNSYIQFFRDGVIEVCTDLYFGQHVHWNEKYNVFYPRYEIDVINKIFDLLKIQSDLDIDLPLFVFLAILNVKDYVINDQESLNYGIRFVNKIDKNNLTNISEIIIENFDVDLPKVMKPIFDQVWNTAGYEQSLNYDKAGNWKHY